MKKLLFSVVSVLALCGVALAAGSTEFGVLCVPSSARETIVSVPWLGSGSGNEAVKVSDLVLTAGLNVGDELKYYNGSKYECWQLQEDSGQKKWVASTAVSDDGVGQESAAQDKTINRGNALILVRDSSHGTVTNKFFIMGKPSTASGSVSLLRNGYTLVAPPFAADTDVNSLTWKNIENGEDQLIVPTDTGYMNLSYIDKRGWCKRSGKKWTNDGVTIPAGKGAWFSSSSDAKLENKSVAW